MMRLRFCALGAVAMSALLMALMLCASASAAGVAWHLATGVTPSRLAAADSETCAREGKCDAFQIGLENVGRSTAEGGEITLTDRLPPGVTEREAISARYHGTEWSCRPEIGATVVKCLLEFHEQEPGKVEARLFAPALTLRVNVAPTASGEAANVVSVTGDAASSQASEQVPVNGPPQAFGLTKFAFEAAGEDGAPATGAGVHPSQLTTSFAVPSILSAAGVDHERPYQAVRELKAVSVELPLGFSGDPLSTKQRCTEVQLRDQLCPPQSKVGVFAILQGASETFVFSSRNEELESSPIYNMVPSHGYPAQLGFSYATVPVSIYAAVVRAASNGPGTAPAYRLRLSAPSLPEITEPFGVSMTFYGAAGAQAGEAPAAAFLTNPGDCTTGTLSARVSVEAWSLPGQIQSRETEAYHSLDGCSLLAFSPTLAFQPSSEAEGGTTTADEPSAFTATLKTPQSSAFAERAPPELRNATVTLPAGLSINPAAGQGLVGCQAQGPEGINIGSSGSASINAAGADEGDPEATELGEGHEGGNNSPYDDGLYHIAPGHCPEASKVGTAEVITPLLSAPLTGSVYVASPKCGGAGQPECTEADATNGNLFGAYLEASGSGVIVKLPGSLSLNPQTGQITATFKENPQLPFSELKLHLKGGPRAPFANPQTCGTATTSSDLEPWSAPITPDAQVSDSFNVTGCPATMPFAPSFAAGTTGTAAGAFTPFVMSFGRQDREQDLSGLSVTLPPGLLARIAGIPLCAEAQANAGSCGAESQIGTTSVLAGAGSTPLYVPGGRVYLTAGYKGQPFGLSIVVPAKAGPFNLGNVVVRAAIHIDPNTAQVTVVSDPLPQIKDGVPFRLKRVDVEINRAGGFTFNPTNCEAGQHITATLTGFQGASAPVSTPFASTGCKSLPFKPTLTVSTQAKTSKANGASLTVKVASKPGEANIRKVDLQLPVKLPSRLSTLQKACTEAQFNKDPAGCPEGSFIGTGVARTPVLSTPLEGPAILVSHGGAAFPDVEFILQGQGVTDVLDGKTQITKGITYSRFETVPDVPITSFETKLPEGPHSVLAAFGSLCTPTTTRTVKQRYTRRVHGHLRHLTRTVKQTIPAPLLMPTTIVGQNGAQLVQQTRVSVVGCTPAKPAVKKKAKRSSKRPGRNR
jgi:hypothetical protein